MSRHSHAFLTDRAVVITVAIWLITVRFTAGYPRHQTGFADIVIERFLDVTLSVTAFIRIRADTEFTGQYL